MPHSFNRLNSKAYGAVQKHLNANTLLGIDWYRDEDQIKVHFRSVDGRKDSKIYRCDRYGWIWIVGLVASEITKATIKTT